MPEYLVKWKISIEAHSPREAAERAWEIMRRPDSTASVFTVIGEDNDGLDYIDLMENYES